jgi:hypothetical protein
MTICMCEDCLEDALPGKCYCFNCLINSQVVAKVTEHFRGGLHSSRETICIEDDDCNLRLVFSTHFHEGKKKRKLEQFCITTTPSKIRITDSLLY